MTTLQSQFFLSPPPHGWVLGTKVRQQSGLHGKNLYPMSILLPRPQYVHFKKNKYFIVHLCNILLLVYCIVKRGESEDSWSGSRTNQHVTGKLLNSVKLLLPHLESGDDNTYFIELLKMRQEHCFPVKYVVRLFLQFATICPLFINSRLTVLNKCIKTAGTNRTHQF